MTTSLTTSTARRLPRVVMGALACAALTGCDTNPHGPGSPGQVDVWVSSPQAHDQALLITFDTTVEGFVPAEGLRHFPDPGASSRTILIVATSPMPAGETRIGSFQVRDLRVAAGVGASVLEAARSDHTLRDTTGGYRVRLAW
jgi:hypothetical protein